MESAEFRLKRFLHYGCEERMYTPNRSVRHSFDLDKVKSVVDMLSSEETDKTIVSAVLKVFCNGFIVEPCASFYVLALVIRKADREKQCKLISEAYKTARKLCENNAEYFLTFTHYLREIAKLDNKKGFGKGWRITVSKWYLNKEPLSLATAVTKVNSVKGWSHKDVLLLSRLKVPENDIGKAAVILYIQKGYRAAFDKYSNESGAKAVLDYLKLVDQARKADNSSVLINLITMNKFTIEYCPPNLLTNHEVWLALIPRMSVQYILSSINRMSKLKLFRNRDIIQEIAHRFMQPDEATNIHPIHVFVTRKQYEEGPNLAIEFQYLQRQQNVDVSAEGIGDENSVSGAEMQQQVQRQPPPRRNAEIIESLSALFNKTLSNLPPTGLRYLIALDMTAAVASRRCYFERFVSVEDAVLLVALCLIKAENESKVKIVSFVKAQEGTESLKELPICKTEENMETLKSKLNTIDAVPANLSLLIEWATRMKEVYDVIVVLSDNTLTATNAYEALKIYQEKVFSKARVITCSFTGPHKKGKDLSKEDMFLICGFDKNVGRLIEGYSRGSF